MSDQKLLNNLSTEDLIKELDQPTQSEQSVNPYKNNDVLDFVYFFNMKPGKEPVKKKLLYKIYTKWSKDVVHLKTFNNILTDYFESDITVLYLDSDAFKLTKNAIEFLEPKKKRDTGNPNYQRHFSNFLSHYSIVPGKTWIEQEVLYYLYRKWKDDKGSLNPSTFSDFCSINLRKKKTETAIFYGVSDLSAVLSQKELDELRQGFTRAKRKSKKPHQIPRPTP